MRRTKEEAEQTRQLILATSLNLFAEQGVSSTSLLQIAKQAGLSRGALYWHFKDKWDIFDALWVQVAGPLTEISAASRSSETTDPLGSFERMIALLFVKLTEDATFRQVVSMLLIEHGVMSQQKTQSRMQEWHDTFQQRRIKTLTRAIECQQLPGDFDVQLGARYLHASIDAVIVHWLTHPDYFDLKAKASHFARAIIAGVKAL